MKKISIRIQLIIIICMIMLPILFLSVFSSMILQKNAGERLKDSYANELRVFRTEIDNICEKLKKETDTLFLQNHTLLFNSGEMDKISEIEFVEELRTIWNRTDMIAGAVLLGKDNEKSIITHNNAVIDYEEYEELVSEVKKIPYHTVEKYGVITRTIADETYWFWVYPYGNYVIAFFSPLPYMINELLALGYETQIEVYLTTEDNYILASNVDNKEIYCKKMSGKIWFSDELNYIDGKVNIMVSETQVFSTLPLSIRILWVGCVLVAVATLILWFLIRKILLIPLDGVRKGMEEIERENMDYRIDPKSASSLEMQYIANQFNRMVQQIEDLKIAKYEVELQKKEIETTNLKLQINPHLLLNSLNLISSLSQIPDYLMIQKFTMHLAAYFRYTLRNPDAMVTLNEEISFVKNYLEIQKIRYPGAFVAVFDIQDGLEEVKIPALLIENFVENSIKHAMRMGEEIEIIVIARKDEDNVIFSIIDNGHGISENVLSRLRDGEIIVDKTGKHIGIWNIRRRLKLEYGEQMELSISSAPEEGTQVWLKIPIKKEKTIK